MQRPGREVWGSLGGSARDLAGGASPTAPALDLAGLLGESCAAAREEERRDDKRNAPTCLTAAVQLVTTSLPFRVEWCDPGET